MKLRLALGIGFLGLLIVGLVAWGGSTQRSITGTIVAVGADDLPIFAPAPAAAGALLLCTPEGEWPARGRELNGMLFVHVMQFTRVLDSRGRFLSSTARFDSLQVGQRIEVWTTEQTEQTDPRQVYAIKIEITGDGAGGECRWQG